MGEIRVKVMLTNTFDEELHRQRKLAKKKIRTYEADAMVDTGAVRSVTSTPIAATKRLVGNPAHPDQPVFKVK